MTKQQILDDAEKVLQEALAFDALQTPEGDAHAADARRRASWLKARAEAIGSK